jgi:hypothetical protein
LAEREEISRGVMAGLSARMIACSLGASTLHGKPRDPSQWRSTIVPGERGRRSGVAPGEAAEAL